MLGVLKKGIEGGITHWREFAGLRFEALHPAPIVLIMHRTVSTYRQKIVDIDMHLGLVHIGRSAR